MWRQSRKRKKVFKKSHITFCQLLELTCIKTLNCSQRVRRPIKYPHSMLLRFVLVNADPAITQGWVLGCCVSLTQTIRNILNRKYCSSFLAKFFFVASQNQCEHAYAAYNISRLEFPRNSTRISRAFVESVAVGSLCRRGVADARLHRVQQRPAQQKRVE